jgi:hypothetical protein
VGTAGRCFVLAIVCACVPRAGADESRSERCYATVDEAARAALAVALPLSQEVEHGGAIWRINNQFCFSAPVRGSEDMVRYRIVVSAAMSLAAIYHTHPVSAPMHKRRRFSDADIAVAVRLRVPSYLGVAGIDDVRVFRDFNRAQYRAARWHGSPLAGR